MKNETIQIPTADGGRLPVYLALPDQAGCPGLVLIQYICGVNRVMRDLANGFAAAGYAVAVPDLYWRQAEGVALLDDPSRPNPAEQQRALDLNAAFDDVHAVADLRDALAFLRSHPACDGRVGALGYCLGGRLSVLMAMRTDVDCAVSYYGVNIDRYLDESEAITCPLMLHMAGEDHLVQAAARQRIVQRLGALPGCEVFVHPRVNHAFALPRGPNYSAPAAEHANAESLRFLRRHLKETRPRSLATKETSR
jgi:carboxymethylenebutenolidase